MSDTNSPRAPRPLGGRARRGPALAAAAVVVLALLAWALLRRSADADQREATPPARQRPADTDEAEAKPSASPATEGGVTSVALDPEALERTGIEAVSLRVTEYRASMAGYGAVVDVDSLAVARTVLAAAVAAATRTEASAASARQELARVQALNAADQTASIKALEEAQATSRGADAEAEAARAAARAREAAVVQAWGPVVGRWAAEGGPSLDDLLERRRVLILVSLPTGSLLGTPPRHATVRGAGDAVQATFVSTATQTDPRTQGAAFFYSAPGAPDLLAGMYVTVALPVGTAERALVVPRAAVVWAEGGAWIYVETGPATFARRSVSTDEPTAEGYAVTDLPLGSRVVTRGAQLLLSEEYRSHARPVRGDEDEGE